MDRNFWPSSCVPLWPDWGGALYIEPASPWENGYCESVIEKLRDECLNGGFFYSLQEARIVIEQWWQQYTTPAGHTRR